jgi:hypothetical protein
LSGPLSFLHSSASSALAEGSCSSADSCRKDRVPSTAPKVACFWLFRLSFFARGDSQKAPRQGLASHQRAAQSPRSGSRASSHAYRARSTASPPVQNGSPSRKSRGLRFLFSSSLRPRERNRRPRSRFPPLGRGIRARRAFRSECAQKNTAVPSTEKKNGIIEYPLSFRLESWSELRPMVPTTAIAPRDHLPPSHQS